MTGDGTASRGSGPDRKVEGSGLIKSTIELIRGSWSDDHRQDPEANGLEYSKELTRGTRAGAVGVS